MKGIYFQFQKEFNYPVFVRLDEDLNEGRMQKVLLDMGFQALNENEFKNIPLNRQSTKILTIKKASPRVIQQVKTTDSLDSMGLESLRNQGNAQIYIFRHIGMMVFSSTSSLWELGVCSELTNTEELTHLRIILTRYTSWALGPLGVLGYWGVTTQDGFVVMKQNQSFGEAVFVDLDKKLILSGQTHKPFQGDFVIYRAEKTIPASKIMSKEELISFLTMVTTYFGFNGPTHLMKKNIYQLGTVTRGEYNQVLSPTSKNLSSV